METKKYSYEEILELANDRGRFQWVTFMLYRATVIFAAINTFSVTFLAGKNEFTCSLNEYQHRLSNSTSINDIRKAVIPFDEDKNKFSECKRYKFNGDMDALSSLDELLNGTSPEVESCSKFSFAKEPLASSLAMKYNAVCQDEWKYTVARSFYMVGFMFGCFVFGPVSDHLGRRTALMIVCLGMFVVNGITLMTMNFYYYIITRLFLGFFSIGTFTIAWCYGGEVSGESIRVKLFFTGYIGWIAGMLVYVLFAYFLRDWFGLQLAITVFHGCLIIFYFIVPESPRWLYVKGQREKADELITKIARWNKVENFPKDFFVSIRERTSQRYSMIDLLKTPNMRIKSLILFLTWMSASLVYYGLSMTTSKLPGDRYTLFLINSAVEPLSIIFGMVICIYFGRRMAISVTMASGALVLIILVFVNNIPWLSITLSMAGKVIANTSFLAVYCITIELMPTVLRNTGLASCSVFARLGAIIEPLITQMDLSAIATVFGTLLLVNAVVVLILPETRGAILPDTLEQSEKFGKHEKMFAVFKKPHTKEEVNANNDNDDEEAAVSLAPAVDDDKSGKEDKKERNRKKV